MSTGKEQLQEMLIDYIDGRLSEEDKMRVEQELVNNAEAFNAYEQLKEVMGIMDRSQKLEPSRELKMSFEHALNQEIERSKPRGKSVFFTPVFYRVAAAVAFIILAGTIGYLVRQHQVREEKLAKLEQEMLSTRALVIDKLNNDLSASQRIQGVNVAMEMPEADDKIVDVLIKLMNEDPNTNVRLAAVEALSKFSHEQKVKRALIDALSTQKDPVIQIALIQEMVRLKEKSVVKELQKIIDDENTMKAVKDEAHSGLFKLS